MLANLQPGGVGVAYMCGCCHGRQNWDGAGGSVLLLEHGSGKLIST